MEEEKVVLSKIPPNDIVAEQAVLGSMLVDTEAVIKAIEVLQPADFYREDNREIYATMLELYGRGKPIDFLTVKENLKLRGMLEKVGAEEYLSSLIDMVPTTSNIEAYAKIVEEKSVLRSLIKAANDVIAYGYAETEEVDKIVDMTEKRIFDVLQKRNTKGYQSIKDVLVESFEEIEELYKSKSNVSGMESGFKDLDLKTSGLNNSDLILVAARPAMGKSAFALNIATYVAKTQKVPVMIFSLEMSKKQMVNRILCSEAAVDSMKVRTGKLDSEDWIKLGKASSELAELQIYIDDTPGLSSAELRAKCRKAKLEKGIGMVVLLDTEADTVVRVFHCENGILRASFWDADLVKLRKGYFEPGEEKYIYRVTDINENTGRCLIICENSGMSIPCSECVGLEMIECLK